MKGGFRAYAVLITFSLHNGWNCWASMNFVNFVPAQALLDVDEEVPSPRHRTRPFDMLSRACILRSQTIGIINMCGFVGVLAGLPAVMVCRWPRVLLMLSGLFNVLPIVLRYTGALHRSWMLVATSNFLVNAAFGVLGAWPPMLASSQWPEARRGAVISVASLSNAVGGALGTLAMPRLAGTALGLLEVLRLQIHVAALLGAMLGCWLWIPPLHMPRASNPVVELRRASHRSGGRAALLDLAASCLLVGVSLLLAGTNQFWLSSLGLSATDSGVANTVYQVVGVAVGVGLGGCAGGERAVRQVLRALHAVLALAIAGAAVLCTQLRADPTGAKLPEGAGPAVLALMALLGGSLMGMLPFLMQQAERALSPLPENVVSGMLYFGALLITATLTRVCTSIAPLSSFKLIGEGRRCASARRAHPPSHAALPPFPPFRVRWPPRPRAALLRRRLGERTSACSCGGPGLRSGPRSGVERGEEET